jgi:hypothetical protein
MLITKQMLLNVKLWQTKWRKSTATKKRARCLTRKWSSAKLMSAMNIWKLKWNLDFNAATQTRMLLKEKYA